MRIEISAGGLSGAISVAEYESNMSSFIKDADSIISAFQTVSNSIASLNGGIGDLQDAFDDITERIEIEETNKQNALEVQQKTSDFIELAMRVDREVADLVDQNKEEFYQVNPWLRPAKDDTPWYEKALQFLFDTAKDIVEGIIAFTLWKASILKNLYNGIISFYEEHKKVIDTILIVVGVLITIATVVAGGGWALVPFLINVLKIAPLLALKISSIIAVGAVVTSVISGLINIVDIWAEVDHPIFNTVQGAFQVLDFVFNIGYSFGNLYNSFNGYRIVNYNGNRIIQNDKIFDPLKNADRINRKPNPLNPLGPDGKSLVLHHIQQTEDGGLIELMFSEHMQNGMNKFWHDTSSGFRSVVDHGYKWRKFNTNYWKWRLDTSFKFKESVNIILNSLNLTDGVWKGITNIFSFNAGENRGTE